MSAYICMVYLLGDMWEVSGTVCKQARSVTFSAQLSSGGWAKVLSSAECFIVPL